MKKSYQCILFDWDGCLANTLPIWLIAITESLQKYGIAASEKDAVPMFSDLTGGALNMGIKQQDILAFRDSVYSYLVSNIHNVQLYEGAEQLLKDLKSQGKMMALISSGSRHSLERMLDFTGVKKYFDLIISGTDVTSKKPHPEGIERAIKELGFDKASAIMIGDSESDLMAASNAQIDSVLFYPDSHSSFYDLENLKKSKPTYTIKSFSQLKALLE